ncbi:MAG: bifunctional DNA-formamidopyrimidine glycosylase/DNA-(apurinic or apyrimidinic site) lyase [Gammaproteobacteria bacterium]|nr:bifunctional DNA-formamidopyrimidine glycosylase/DNA-(apurinic or apyrimidinic site) lyase [Gammaproteobacteria bacterium]MBU1656284.1 bifunctional DNA-formamidopyrimidine glycosylase/DNA-(apurinic or apyrimidinic site) lyase [Gammaproteobacteria bacterium]MBU1959849.1 bifunctional DNA-formamidopyrimidine glycosylase/DNA-(apurinic or apyrimidinic site) lyase [Gammaproteobacteria bacterium]
MPELPEVETTRRGIAPHLVGRVIDQAVIRDSRLRWPIPTDLPDHVQGRCIRAVERRAKYLLLRTDGGTLIIHLGMSGSLRILPAQTPPGKHDPVDICVGGDCLRLRDPRRFGALLWTEGDPLAHPLLKGLGPEPLDDSFDGDYLHGCAKGRRSAVKVFLMDGRILAGVGNIYANEALFMAGIHPARKAGKVGWERYQRLAAAIKEVLLRSIEQGGTSLRDFIREDGRPGYFAQELRVYGRTDLPCLRCGEPIRETRLGQRSTFHCARCQR